LHAPGACSLSRALSGLVERVSVHRARSAEGAGELLIGIVPLATSRVVSERPDGHCKWKRKEKQRCREPEPAAGRGAYRPFPPCALPP
jgi:hypothetical protein